MSKLQVKTALVTGSSTGIGLAICHALAKQGVNFALHGLGDSQTLNAQAQQLGDQYGVQAVGFNHDLSCGTQARKLVQNTQEHFGSLDILVNNAGIQKVGALESYAAQDWDKIIAVNLSAPFHATAAAIPVMKQAGWGRIINIASVHGLIASPYKAAYISAKHGLVGLTKTTALELAEFGITCNAICPGYVMTPLVENQIQDQMNVHKMDREQVISQVMLSRQPTKKFIDPSEVAAYAAFLCTDAAHNITGSTQVIDGGWTAL